MRQDESEIINTTDNNNKYSLRPRSDSNQQAFSESRKTTVKKVQGRSVAVKDANKEFEKKKFFSSLWIFFLPLTKNE